MNLAEDPKPRRRRVAVAALAALAAVLVVASAAAEAPGSPGLFKKMIAAIENGDYEAFVADGDPAFKAALTKTAFDSGTSQVLPRLRAGYTPAYLGTLNQGGFMVHLWKLTFKDGKDDVLVSMALKDGKVGGFRLQ